MSLFRYLLSLFVFLHAVSPLFADTFVVTSKNDNGPGTLRQAILQATQNGTAVTDYIHFALPGTTKADRTIVLASNLPDLNANIVIDGTTQAGAPFGISNARVIILYNGHRPYVPLYGLRIINAENVAIYGLYLKCALQLSGSEWANGCGIYLSGAKNIRIGDVNKGNIVSGWVYGIFSEQTPRSENIEVVSNILGVAEDGVNTHFDDYPYNDSYNYTTIKGTDLINLRVGGTQAAQGNLINGGAGCIVLVATQPAGNGYVEVLNNKIGIDHTGHIPLRGQVNDPMINIDGVDDGAVNSRGGTDLKVTVNNNLFGTWGTIGAITCGNIDNDITIQGNKLGTDIDGQVSSGSSIYTSIWLIECTKGIIGGSQPGEGNIVAYNTWGPGMRIEHCENITISRNSTFCNRFGSGIFIEWTQSRPAPFVTINSVSASHVGGTAQPHSTVELFYDDDCPDYCEGKTYFATVQADDNGVWQYNGPINGYILATATIPSGATSPYSQPMGDAGNVEVIPYDCHHKGAIRGVKIVSGTAFCWMNEKNEVVGTDLDLENLEPGQYYMVISHGMDVTQGCPGYVGFTIKDNNPHIRTDGMMITPATCGQADGDIFGLEFTGEHLAYSWKDWNGKEVSTEAYAHNQLPGKYTVTVTDTESGCTDAAGPFEVPDLSGNRPLINAGNVKITPSDCFDKGGSITGLSVIATTTIGYAWWNQDHVMVGTGEDLPDVPSGKYVLEVSDGTVCGTALSDTFFVPTNSIPADVTATSAQSRGPLCGRNDGYIREVVVNSSDPFSYTWRDAGGQTVGNTAALSGLGAGAYILTLTNGAGCEKRDVLAVYLEQPPLPVMDEREVLVTDDHCNGGEGSIANIKVAGEAPFAYRWYNNADDIVSTALTMTNARAGGYYLEAIDRWGCNTQSSRYTIGNSNQAPPPPQLDDITIIRGTPATIRVNNPQPGTYRLFDASGSPAGENETGVFTTGNLTASTWFFVGYSQGDCVSPQVKVIVSVIDEVKVVVPTAFSPNGDGINDLFHVKAPGVTILYFKVYNRWGSEVFAVSDLSAGWDGTRGGLNLPIGSYVWVLKGKDLFGNIINKSGSVLLIR